MLLNETYIIIGIAVLLIPIIIQIALIYSIFKIADYTDMIKQQLGFIEKQNQELIKLVEMQNELLSIEMREQRFMHGYPTNRRLDGERPDE